MVDVVELRADTINLEFGYAYRSGVGEVIHQVGVRKCNRGGEHGLLTTRRNGYTQHPCLIITNTVFDSYVKEDTNITILSFFITYIEICSCMI